MNDILQLIEVRSKIKAEKLQYFKEVIQMVNRKTLILTSIITLLPILAGMILWNKLPNTMAIHFGLCNDANMFSSKIVGVIGLPLILLIIHLFSAFVTAKTPRKQNISEKMYMLVLWLVPCISIIISAIIYSYNIGINI